MKAENQLRIAEVIAEIYTMGLVGGANDAFEYAAKLAEDNGKPTRLSEEIRSLKK